MVADGCMPAAFGHIYSGMAAARDLWRCQDGDGHWLLASFPPLSHKAFSLSLDTRVVNELDIRGGRRPGWSIPSFCVQKRL